MTNTHAPLSALVGSVRGAARTQAMLDAVEIDPFLDIPTGTTVTRAQLAMALCLVLFDDLLDRVPEARAYVEESRIQGRRILFDHGALRTVAWPHLGELPPGIEAFARILEPLGFRMNGVYPLDRLGMTGHAYCHADLPETLPQFFVSELHPERFSPAFQHAVTRVLCNSTDALGDWALDALERLRVVRALPLPDAQRLLPEIAAAFTRRHPVPRLADYEHLLAESAEMAWIATEGNAFNHGTDRVDDIESIAQTQRRLGRAIKDDVEVSRSGRVRQTAFRAARVLRDFRADDGSLVRRAVPGSFHEIISRAHFTDDQGVTRLDLSFDSGNAQQIFRMTGAATARAEEDVRA